jgi:zinc protease
MTCRHAMVVAALVAVPGSLVGSQPPSPAQPSGAVVMKGKAPVSDKMLQVKLPRAQEGRLPNGLRVLLIEDHRAPQVAMQMLIRGAGGYYDPADHLGLAQFTAANLREGTTTRTSPQIAEQLERLAATLNTSAGMASEDANIQGGALTEHADALLDLAADLVLRPTFPEQELGRYKVQTRAQLTQQRANPAFLARERFSIVMAEGHPDGRTAPTVESLDKTTRESLAAFHRARYVPDHAVIALAGDITLADAMKKIQARFGAWRKAGAAAPSVADPGTLSDPGVHLVARPNSVQTNLIVGVQAIRYSDEDFYRLTVMDKIIGGGPSGRLFRHLREEKGYTYGASSTLASERFRGVWLASTSVRSEVTEPALRDLLDELRQMREIRVPDREFADAKRSLIASFALDLESPSALLFNALTQWRYGLPADYWDRFPERITAVTQADVQAMAKKYLDPSRIQVIAVGDQTVVEPVLRKLGRLQLYDADGKLLK